MSNTELQGSLATTINTKWKEARTLAGAAEDKAIDALNAIREVGILLGPRWKEIQSELEFGERSIQMCLSFARKHPDPVTDATRAIRMLDEIRMTTGLLAFADGHGPQQLHSPSFFSIVSKQMTSFRSEWKKQLARSPLEAWPHPSLEQFITQIEPAVQELNGIYNKAKAQLETHNAV
jgi:hypothetical protein